MVHYRLHNRRRSFWKLKRLNPIHFPAAKFLIYILILSSSLSFGPHSVPSLQALLPQIPYAYAEDFATNWTRSVPYAPSIWLTLERNKPYLIPQPSSTGMRVH